MYILYQSVQLPSPAPPPPGGRWEGPPEVAGVPLPLEGAGSSLWQGVDDFPPCLGAVVVPLWPEVDSHLQVLGGSLSAPTGGWLGPVWSFPRGSSRWSLSLSWLRWKRFTTRVGIRCPRPWLPCKVGVKMDQALLDYSPVVVPTLADPSSKITEALEVLAGDLFEQSSHVGHKLEWPQFFYIHPLTGLPFGHYREKLGDGNVPLIPFQ